MWDLRLWQQSIEITHSADINWAIHVPDIVPRIQTWLYSLCPFVSEKKKKKKKPTQSELNFCGSLGNEAKCFVQYFACMDVLSGIKDWRSKEMRSRNSPEQVCGDPRARVKKATGPVHCASLCFMHMFWVLLPLAVGSSWVPSFSSSHRTLPLVFPNLGPGVSSNFAFRSSAAVRMKA